jgi:nicotinic acid mononucleotide adenylyltransferase
MEFLPETPLPDSGVEVRSYVLLNRAGDRTPFYLLPGLHIEISASEIRAQIRDLVYATLEAAGSGQSLLPDAVFDYIRAHGLYRYAPASPRLAHAPTRGYD